MQGADYHGHATMPVDLVLSRLRDRGLRVIGGRDDQWSSQCPVPSHGKGRGDKSPSLSIGIGKDDRALLDCKAGCPTEQIVSVLGLGIADLFVREENSAKIKDNATVVMRHIYRDAGGRALGMKLRPHPNGAKVSWQGQKPPDCPLYRLPELSAARANGETRVDVAEGERDADVLVAHGYTATTNPGGANEKWKEEYFEAITGFKKIVIHADRDEAGYRRAVYLRGTRRPGALLQGVLGQTSNGLGP